MKNIFTSVVIPNYNGKDLLGECLLSLSKQSYKNFETIVVDNGSTDGSVEFIQENYPKVSVIILNKNTGFAGAINKGVEKSLGKYVVFINNDTSVEKDFLANLVSCADKHPEVISVNSRLLNYYDRTIIDGVGILLNEVGQARSIGWQEKDGEKFKKEVYILGATGGASLFKRNEFLKIGGFDEKYFMYFEEVDFALKAQFLGFKSIYCPKAIVFHKHKATAKKRPAHIEYWQFRNMTQTIIRDFPAKILLKNFRWLKIILVHLNTYFYQIKKGFIWAPFLADFWIIIHLPQLLLERKMVQKNIKINLDNLESLLEQKKITFWKILKSQEN